MKRVAAPSVIAVLLLTGCGAESDAVPGAGAEAAATANAGENELGAAESTASPGRFLPAAEEDGTLPRTLHGYRLLDPAPAGSEHEASFPFEGAVYRYDVLRRQPLASVRVYSVDDEVFRIEHADDAPPAMAELVATGLERYGEPYQREENEVIWITDESTLTITHYPGTGGVRIAIEDVDGVGKAYNRGGR